MQTVGEAFKLTKRSVFLINSFKNLNTVKKFLHGLCAFGVCGAIFAQRFFERLCCHAFFVDWSFCGCDFGMEIVGQCAAMV